MSEPGSDSTPWGFNIFDVDHIFTSNYYGNSNQCDVNIFSEQYMSDGDYDTLHRSVDNDDTAGHALEDGFTQLSVVESPETLPIRHEYYQGSTVSQDCHSPSRPYYPGYRFGPGDMDDAAPSTSYSGPEDGSFDEEVYSYDLEVTEESELDGEVGKRLNQMIPVPHVPRINGDIPSVDEATSDHQRLLDSYMIW